MQLQLPKSETVTFDTLKGDATATSCTGKNNWALAITIRYPKLDKENKETTDSTCILPLKCMARGSGSRVANLCKLLARHSL